MQAQDDVAALEWTAIDDLPLHEGFQNARDGFRDLQKWYKENNK